MQPSPDADELAAVVADGRPFDWSGLSDSREYLPLQALWRAARQVEGERAGPPAVVARMAAPLVWVAIVALAKATATAGLMTLAIEAVDPVQGATLASFTLVGAGLLYGGHRDLRARRLGVVLLLLGAVMTKPLLRQIAEAGAGPPLLIALLQGVVVESLLPLALWLFVEVFPQALWSPRDATVLRWGLASSTLLGFLLFASNALLIAGIDLSGLRWLNRDTTTVNAFWPLVISSIAPALLFMLWRRRDAKDDERAKVAGFVAGLVLALLPATLIIVLYYTPVRLWMLSHYGLTGALMYVGLMGMPVATAYAVLEHRVLRVDLVLRNAARYVLAKGLLLVLALGPLALLAAYVYQHRELTVGALFTDSTGRTLLAVSAAGTGLLAVRDRIQRYMDRALRRDSVSLASALDLFARRSGEGVGLGDVAEAMQRSFVAAFHPEAVALLVADRARDAFVPIGAAIAPLSRTTWLARSLAGVRDAVVVDLEDPHGVARLLPPLDQHWLADGNVVVLAPLVAGGGTVCGLVALGPMSSGRRYTNDDLRFIGALTAAAASAVESRLARPSHAASHALDDVRWDDESGRECAACGRVFTADGNECPTCAQSTVSMAIPVHLHGKFTVTRRLGAGGMGVAYLAQDDALGRPVALKTLPRVRPEAVEQLRREARAMARVSHQALAAIHGLESWRAVPVLVVQYLPGGTLADRLRQGPMPEAEVVAIARHVLGGLRALHEAGLLHRDLKPSNIGFTADGTAKVLDFGLSRLGAGPADGRPVFDSPADGVSTESRAEPDVTSLAGTPAYMSPELVAGRAPAPADDLWALAVVMVEAIQGRHPWTKLTVDDVLRKLRAREAPDVEIGELATRGLRGVLVRAMAPTAEVRPQTAEQFARELAEFDRLQLRSLPNT